MASAVAKLAVGHNFTNRAYVGAGIGAAVGYAIHGVSTAVVSYAVSGATAVVSYPFFKAAVDKAHPAKGGKTRALEAVALSAVAGFAAPAVITYAAGAVAGTLIILAIEAAILYKLSQTHPQVGSVLNYAFSWIK